MATFTRGTSWNNSSNTITPGTTNKTVTISTGGKYVDKDIVVTVAGDVDLVAGNIKSGVNIFGVTGTLSPETHSSYTPSSTYFTTTNTGYGQITANKYATSTYYIKSGGAAASGTKSSAVSGSSGSYYITPSVTRTAGWITAGSTNGTAISFNTIALQTNQDFVINDGSNSWTWKKDSNGNICII